MSKHYAIHILGLWIMAKTVNLQIKYLDIGSHLLGRILLQEIENL